MEHGDVENEFSRSILFCKIKNGTLNDNLQTADFCPLCNLISYGTSSSYYSLIQTLASIALLLWNFMQCIWMNEWMNVPQRNPRYVHIRFGDLVAKDNHMWYLNSFYLQLHVRNISIFMGSYRNGISHIYIYIYNLQLHFEILEKNVFFKILWLNFYYSMLILFFYFLFLFYFLVLFFFGRLLQVSSFSHVHMGL